MTSCKDHVRTATSILAAGLVLLGSAAAQQTPATNTTPAAKPRPSTATSTQHASTATKPKPLVLETEKDKQSYAIGLNFGKNLHRDDIDVDPKIVLQGLQDALAGGKVLLTDDQIKTVMTDLQNQVRQKREEKRQALIESNKKDGAAFLAANATKEGVVTLPSGLQYKVLVAGTGPKPSATDSVVCNYRGTLLDNTEFDSSYKTRAAGDFPCRRSHQGMDRGSATDARGIEMAAVYSSGSCLWRARPRTHRAQRHSHLRGGVALHSS